MTKDEDKRDKALKRMLNTPPESNKEMVVRREKERKEKARNSLVNKSSDER